jgi:hypothetical protein
MGGKQGSGKPKGGQNRAVKAGILQRGNMGEFSSKNGSWAHFIDKVTAKTTRVPFQ